MHQYKIYCPEGQKKAVEKEITDAKKGFEATLTGKSDRNLKAKLAFIEKSGQMLLTTWEFNWKKQDAKGFWEGNLYINIDNALMHVLRRTPGAKTYDEMLRKELSKYYGVQIYRVEAQGDNETIKRVV